MATLDFDIYLNHRNVQNEVYGLLELLKPGWKKEEITIKVLDEGHVNGMVACYVTKLEESVVVRVFGDVILFPIHKKQGREIGTVRVMNELGLCVPILCTFNNGYCMEFVHGEGLTAEFIKEVGMEEYIRATLHELARYHSNKNMELAKLKGIDPTPVIFENSDFMLEVAPNFDDPSVRARLPNLPQNMKGELETMLKKLTKLLREADIPVAFCHNDTNPSNVFYMRETKTVTFLDYESCGFNYALYDVAYFLLTLYGGIKLKDFSMPKEHLLPSLRYYLECRREQGDIETVTDDVVEKWYRQFKLVELIYYFWYGVILTVVERESDLVKDVEKAPIWFVMNGMPIPETQEEIIRQIGNLAYQIFANRFLHVKEELDKMQCNAGN